MKIFIVCAVEETIIPSTMKDAPIKATYRRPIRSERDPTNGQTAANARRLANTFSPEISGRQWMGWKFLETHKPDPPIRAANISVDVWRDAAKDVDGDLRARPEECHGHQRHETMDTHLICTCQSTRWRHGSRPRTGGSWSWSSSSPTRSALASSQDKPAVIRTVSPQAVLLIVVGMAGDALVGMDLLHLRADLLILEGGDGMGGGVRSRHIGES